MVGVCLHIKGLLALQFPGTPLIDIIQLQSYNGWIITPILKWDKLLIHS